MIVPFLGVIMRTPWHTVWAYHLASSVNPANIIFMGVGILWDFILSTHSLCGIFRTKARNKGGGFVVCGKIHFKDTEELGTKERNRRMPLTLLVIAKPQRQQAQSQCSFNGKLKVHPTICAMFFKHGSSLVLEASFGPITQSGMDRVWNCTLSRRRVSLHFFGLFLSCTVSKSSLQSHHKSPFFYLSPSVMLFTV